MGAVLLKKVTSLVAFFCFQKATSLLAFYNSLIIKEIPSLHTDLHFSGRIIAAKLHFFGRTSKCFANFMRECGIMGS